MANVTTWRFNISEPGFAFIQTIKIPEGITVGKIMILSDQMVPLMTASELK